jgi:hypothetical protein
VEYTRNLLSSVVVSGNTNIDLSKVGFVPKNIQLFPVLLHPAAPPIAVTYEP